MSIYGGNASPYGESNTCMLFCFEILLFFLTEEKLNGEGMIFSLLFGLTKEIPENDGIWVDIFDRVSERLK